MPKLVNDRQVAQDTDRFSTAHEFDAEVSEEFDDAHELFDGLRSKCPVAHSNDFGGFWLLTKYADVEACISDPENFTTAVQNVVPRVATTSRRPPLHLDPPEHTPYRRALAPLFSKPRMRFWGTRVREIADQLFAPLPAKGRADICEDFSYHLPIHVLAEFFNIGEAEATKIRDIGQDFNLALQTKDMDGLQRYSMFLYEMAQGIIDARKEEPQDPTTDPTSALLAARDNGEPLPDHLILGTIRQMLVVGIIAPTTFIGSMAVHFCRHPEHFQIMKDDPERIPDVCEELLRLYTPYRGFARTPTQDVEIGGRKICKDEPIALAFAAANRDPDMFENPNEFQLDREKGPPNIAFGRGPHRCAGEPLARVMLLAALEAFAKHCDGFIADGPTPMTTWPEYGPYSVPVRFR